MNFRRPHKKKKNCLNTHWNYKKSFKRDFYLKQEFKRAIKAKLAL